jgi:predicted DsbA family dithiol-disulfide isomerase
LNRIVARIEVFADMVCPFTHVGLRRLSEARGTAERPVAVRVRAWPLETINGRALAPELVGREIEGLRETVAPDLFTGFDPDTFPATSIPAFGLAAAAYALDDASGEAVSLALRDALFEEGLDITDGEVLDAIGRRFGVERLRGVDAETAVRTDWERGRARHVQGSPHFFVGDRDWFCPSLEITHQGGRFEIRAADETMRDFYTAALA